MKNYRIYIIGASGSGKTTLAKALAAQLTIPHFDSDDYFHYPTDPPFQKQRSPEDRAYLLSKDLKPHPSWVLSGGAGTWQPAVDFDPTLVVFLYLPADVRLARLKDREKKLFGDRLARGGDMAEKHKEFMEWTSGYDNGTAEGTNTLPLHEIYLSKIQSPLRIETPLTTEQQVQLVMNELTR